MTEETQTESPADENVSQASETQQQEPSPDYVSKTDLEATLGALEERLAKRLKQSSGDRIKAVSSEVQEQLAEFDGMLDTLKPLLREGVTQEELTQAKERQFIRALMEEQGSPDSESAEETPPQAPQPEQASSPTGLEAEIQSILETHGVSGSEPELREYLEQNKGKPWYEVGAGFNDLAGQVAARAQGSPGGVAPSQGNAPQRDLVAEYRAEVAALRKQPHRNPRLLRAVQDKYREMGLTEEQLNISPSDSIKTRDYLYAAEGMQ